MNRLVTFFIVLSVSLAMASVSWAGDDPSIKGKQRSGIQSAMANHIVQATKKGVLLHYDPVSGKLEKLKLKKLHEGIVKKGDFFVSCADFTNARGINYDLDFMVIEKGGKYQVNQTLVHAIDGKKRPYQLEE